jgi:hypothetical protein
LPTGVSPQTVLARDKKSGCRDGRAGTKLTAAEKSPPRLLVPF